MSLAPTTSYVGAMFEQPQAVTSYRKFFPGSHETITISDATSADYTKTVAVCAVGEYRPYNLVKVAVTSAHFTVNAVVTISSANRNVGDVVEFVWTPSDVPSPRTLTIKDDAATPNTLSTISSTTDAARSLSVRKFLLTSAGTWQEIDVVSLATGAVTAATGTFSGAVTAASFAATGAVSGATSVSTGASTAASYAATGDVSGATGTFTGAVTLGTHVGGIQTLTGAGAVNVTSLITKLVSTGANALTLADGVNGQEKIIWMLTDGGDATLTPTSKTGYTTIVFNDALDSVRLVFFTTQGWVVLANNGTTIS